MEIDRQQDQITPDQNESSAEKDLLLEGFEAFSQATIKLQEYYRSVELKVDELTQELEIKNKQLEQNLIEKERVKNYLSNIFDSTAVGIIVTDLEGYIASINNTASVMLKKDTESISGTHLKKLFKVQLLPDLSRLNLGQQGANHSNSSNSLSKQEVDFVDNDKNTLKLLVSTSLMYSENDELLGFIINIENISELKKLQSAADRKNRFTVMGEMAATIAHEIRNPLGSIELFTSLIKKEMDADENDPSVLHLGHISSAIHSMNHIISNLLEFSRNKPIIQPIFIDFNDFLKENLKYYIHLTKNNHIGLKFDLKAKNASILGDKELLKQVVHNLMTNAMESILEKGTVSITTQNFSTTSKEILNKLDIQQNSVDLLEVKIKDDGYGMSQTVVKQIFDPFFTTKNKGTGLGLANVHNNIEAHNAIIDVQSVENSGTEFTLLFPIKK